MKVAYLNAIRLLSAVCASFILVTQTAFAGLPEVPIPEKWKECEVSEDCGFVTEACRSCGTPISLNKKFLAAFDEADRKLREENRTVLSCEACSQKVWKAGCVNHLCRAMMQLADPGPEIGK